MTRDVEAVQLLSVGSAPNHRNTFFDQCMFFIAAIVVLSSHINNIFAIEVSDFPCSDARSKG